MATVKGARDKELECWQINRRVTELEGQALEFYVRIMRPLRRRFGDEVLDVAEGLRRADGAAVGAQRRARLTGDDPREAVKAHLQDLSDANWSRKLACVFCTPTDGRLELVALHCPVGETFRRLGEPELGLSWCAYDFGYTGALGNGRVALVEPRHYHLGHPYCFQIHQVMDDPREVAALMTAELTGWRRYAAEAPVASPMGEMPARARFFPDAGMDQPMLRGPLEEQIATYVASGVQGFIRLARAMAERFGEGAFDVVQAAFAAEGITPQRLRSGPCPQMRGWYWSDLGAPSG